MSKAEDILNETQFRNICFVGAGHLSNASRKRKAATLERFSKAYDKEVKDHIKALVVGLSKGQRQSDEYVRKLVTQLNLIKPATDELNYQPTGYYQSDIRVIRAFVQRHLPMKYLKIMAKYSSHAYK